MYTEKYKIYDLEMVQKIYIKSLIGTNGSSLLLTTQGHV